MDRHLLAWVLGSLVGVLIVVVERETRPWRVARYEAKDLYWLEDWVDEWAEEGL